MQVATKYARCLQRLGKLVLFSLQWEDCRGVRYEIPVVNMERSSDFELEVWDVKRGLYEKSTSIRFWKTEWNSNWAKLDDKCNFLTVLFL